MKLDNNPAEAIETILGRVVEEWVEKKPQLVIGMERISRENGGFLLLKSDEKFVIMNKMKAVLKHKESVLNKQMHSLVKRGVLTRKQAKYAQK
jgi:hypothetical protein